MAANIRASSNFRSFPRIRLSLPVLIALVGCLVVVAVGIATCGGGSDGPAAFLSRNGDIATFVQWKRVGDVSGTISETKAQSENDVTLPFTGTVRDDSVRLQITSSEATGRVNGRLDGDTLELTVPQDDGPRTWRFTPASKDDYKQAVQNIRDRDRDRDRER